MRRFLASPRRRRRLAWAGAWLAALAAAAVGVLLLPEAKAPPASAPLGPPVPPGLQVREEGEVALSPADRRAITETIDRFVHAAVERRDLALAWELAGPGLRAGTTRRQWLRGELPVFPFPARAASFPDWLLAYAYRDRVGLELLIHAEPETKRGAITFAVDVVRDGERWLVDTWFPAAIFNDPEDKPWVVGAVDFTPNYDQRDRFETPKFAVARLGPAWLVVPVAIFALLAAVPLAAWLVHARRSRRAFAAYRASSAVSPPASE
jgi:hypothetical protein